MPSTATLISQLKSEYPQYSFTKSSDFLWSPDKKIIFYCEKDNNDYIYILHELSHALLSHLCYGYDITLITMEREAWDKAVELAKDRGLTINNDLIQSSLDTYRDWLHARSTCPKCQATGLQSKKNTYNCLACGYKWRVNEARSCSLRRYKIQK